VKLATRLYVTGAVATKREAAEAAGINGSYFSIAGKRPDVQEFADELDRKLAEKTITLSAAIEELSRKALRTMGSLMDSNNQAIQYKASSDILDRNPETSKTHKHQVSSFSLSGEDAKSLAHALVKSTEARRLYGQDVQSDFVRIPIAEVDQDAGQRLLPPEVRRLDEGGDVSAQGRGPSSTQGTSDLSEGPAAERSAAEEHETEVEGPVVHDFDITKAGKQLRLM
jgi:hypothetical protein